jgi:hypothetical protein
MKTREEIFKAALSEMGYSFSSRDFAQAARRHGLPDKLARQGICAEFLHRECLQTGGLGTRTWTKKEPTASLSKISKDDLAAQFFAICKERNIVGDPYDLISVFYEVKQLFGK